MRFLCLIYGRSKSSYKLHFEYCFKNRTRAASFSITSNRFLPGHLRIFFSSIASAARGIVGAWGLPPEYLSKYESGVDDTTRKEKVRSDYEVARNLYGNNSKMDSIWK